MDRTELIQKYFLDIELSKDTIDVYVVRKAILSAVMECTPFLKGVLLDVGCGQMPYREAMLAANNKLQQYIGLDLEISSIHNTSIADLHWDGEKIPLANESIDSAMATEVLEHSFQPEKTLAEIKRVLKPGGVFFFTVPFLWPLHEVPYDAYRYTPFSLKMLLENAGFDNINIRSLGGLNASLAQMLGLWISQSKLKMQKKEKVLELATRLIPYLLNHDVKDNSFGHHCMMTGLYGTAIKKLNS